MSPHDIPPLIPKPPEKDWADYNTNPDPGRTRKRRRASMLSARDVLALPTVTLAPGATLADSELVMPDAAAVVFIPNTEDRGIITYSDTQKQQMVRIYHQLPYGTKKVWLARHDMDASRVIRWMKRFDLGTFTQQQRAAVYTGATTPVPVVLDAEAIISLVHQYVAAPHGTKQALLDKHGILQSAMHGWIEKVANGTIAHYTHTRKAEPLNTPKATNNDMVTITRKEYNALQRENAKLRKENKLWKDTSDVLGKAIASLPENTGGDSNVAGKSSQANKHNAMRQAYNKKTS